MWIDRPSMKAFLAHPRAGSRSVAELLKLLGWKQKGGHHQGPPDIDVSEFDCFCVVRNHWAALASWYQWQNNNSAKPITGDWIANCIKGRGRLHVEPGYLWYWIYRVPGIKVIRLEDLHPSLYSHLESIGADLSLLPPKVPRIGDDETKEKDYTRLYTKSSAKLVYYLFHREIDHYGYSFNG